MIIFDYDYITMIIFDYDYIIFYSEFLENHINAHFAVALN